MTDIVEEARALLAQATPGPWRYATNGFDRMVVGGPVVVREFIDTTYETGTFIVGGEPSEGAVDEDDPNIKLIIAAPSLLADLADECERLRAENAQHVDFRVSINGSLPRPFGVTVLGAIAELRAENARLREAIPGDDVRDEINDASVMLHEDGGMPATLAWIARLDAAKGVR